MSETDNTRLTWNRTAPDAPVYSALIHYPVRDKLGMVVTSAVTNLDVHDGARLAVSYGMQAYFLVTPLVEQRNLVRRITGHWVEGRGAKRNPKRREAMELAVVAASLQEVIDKIVEAEGAAPTVVGTSAVSKEDRSIYLEYPEVRERIWTQPQPVLLIFGTGWGLAEELKPKPDTFLPPIKGPVEYNHLAVRSAMAITVDRLLGV